MNRQFTNLGVTVKAGDVWQWPAVLRSQPLGPLAGAQAQVTGVSGVHAARAALGTLNPLVGPFALLAGARDAQVVIQFADGTYWTHKIEGRNTIARAQREAAELTLMGAGGRRL